ncbi:MAG: polyprenyl synthetase family protein [Planctomycetales bacterium]|nr:polyprenyl synthetase family protein [Planctomycetales bacterium]
MTSLSAPFTDFAARVRQRVDDALAAALPADPDCPALLHEAMLYSLLAPGKRLRPLLVLMAAEACGSELSVAMPAACAVEMIHAYSLVHDDLPAMDDDAMRRGRPSCHAKFGEATAILVGDALQARAFELLAREMAPAVAATCCAELGAAAGASALVGGQCDDLAAEGQDGTLEQLQAIHRRKTGALIRVSLRLGAIAAGAPTDATERLDRYGQRVGVVFQITDDLLDHEGSAEDLGKATQKDAKRGKLTYPGLLGVEASREQARQLTLEALADLAPLGPPAKPLCALAQFVLERRR